MNALKSSPVTVLSLASISCSWSLVPLTSLLATALALALVCVLVCVMPEYVRGKGRNARVWHDVSRVYSVCTYMCLVDACDAL